MGEPTESQIRLHTCKEPEKKSRTYHKDHYLHCYEKSMQFETPSIEVSETKVEVSAPNAKIECQALPDVEITEIVCEDKLQVKGFKLDQAVDLCWKSCDTDEHLSALQKVCAKVPKIEEGSKKFDVSKTCVGTPYCKTGFLSLPTKQCRIERDVVLY
jgi:hypothetical protein